MEKDSLYQKYGQAIPRSIKGKRYLYKYGLEYYSITALGVSNPANREMMTDGNTGRLISIYQRINDRWSGRGILAIDNLSPDAPTVAYKTLSEQSRRAHSGLLFGLVGVEGTEDGEDAPHEKSIMGPSVRGARTEEIVSKISSHLHLFGKKMQPARRMRRLEPGEIQILAPPVLRFAGDQEVRTKLETAGRDRIAALRGIGPAESLPFPDQQFNIRPASMPEGVWKDFKQRFLLQVQDLCGEAVSATPVKYDDRNAHRPRLQFRAIEKAIGNHHGCGLLVLPVQKDSETQTKLYNHLKRRYWKQLHTQCADLETILSFYHKTFQGGEEKWYVQQNQHGLYRSYLRYLALGYLMANRKWLWKLGRGTMRNQVHVGIDVYRGIAVFTFIYGDADLITFYHSKSIRDEKLSSDQVYEALIHNLGPDLAQLNIQAASIVFHRDGKVYASEIRGINRALDELCHRYNSLAKNLKVGIVEIHKSSATRPRIYRAVSDRFANPDMGLFARIGDHEGVVATTGYPMLKKGTARILYFEIVEGDIDVTDIAHDIYALSHLAFASPGSCMRLPFSVALADYILRQSTPGTDASLWDDEEDPESAIKHSFLKSTKEARSYE